MANKKIIYAGVFVNKTSEETLKKLIESIIINETDWDNYDVYCHHMTIAFHTMLTEEIKNWVDIHRYDNVLSLGTEIGISDKAIAIRVENHVPCTNKIKHITLATNRETKGKPVDSNNITVWRKLETPIYINGTIDYFTK